MSMSSKILTTSMKTTKTTNSKRLKFFSVNDGDYEGSMIDLLKRAGMQPLLESELDAADIIVFNGGADIGAKIYQENPISNGIPREPSLRDVKEMEIFAKYMSSDKLLVGICRGAQLLNCLNGGTLWQDVNNHNRDHMMTDVETGVNIRCTSTHHQMMRPNYATAKVIATAHEATRKDADGAHFPTGGPYPDDGLDTEVVWYANTHSLCIQGHPEYVPGSIYAEYCLELMSDCLREVRSCVV